MSPAAALAFALALAAACAMPGPSTAAVVAHVLASGPRSAAVLCAGLVAGELFWLAAAAFGVAVLAQQFQALFAAIKYAGMAYLLYLACRFWTAPAAPQAASTRAAGRWRQASAGLALALGNPKTMLFYLALLPCVVPLDGLSTRDVLALAAIAVAVVGAVLAAYVLLAGRLRRIASSPPALRRVHRGGAVLMAGAAVAVAAR